MRIIYFAAVTILCASGLQAWGHSSGTKNSAPITLEFGNMKSEKPNLMRTAKYLKSQSKYRTSVNYASQFIAMMRALKTVGVKNLSSSENDLILSVSEPTNEAIVEYRQEKQAAVKKVDDRSKSIQKWLTDEHRKKVEAEKLAEEKRQADLKTEQEQKKIDAMNRQAAAQERTARNMEIQTQLNARMNRYYGW